MDRIQPQSAELRRLLDERTADLQRVKAEYDNYRKQVRRDRMAVREVATENVLRALLPVLDAVEGARRQEALSPGLQAVADVLETQLGSLGLKVFGAEGEPFDPLCHEAVTHVVATEAEGLTCTEILSPGYRVGDRLLRPARVTVTGPPPAGGVVLGGRTEAGHGGEGLQAPPGPAALRRGS
ncbi:nucleotide exchange factor GrpE [Streptomyces glomeratus]|uniref:Protein GrpE n=1 Tax=Streptomyces glomeratus TaxID=284452 RepID=A0ABP6LBB4_9ACTN|nr:nucleotide exchange factor GrpE [Streptomyces glomeratus]MCF1510998.1 nucleotide exchange factor GrpE [Streptomyces glomeratus]